MQEALLLEPMYEVPCVDSSSLDTLLSNRFLWLIRGSDIRHVLITAEVVRGEKPAQYWKKGEGVVFWEAWATEEGKNNARTA